MKIEISNDEIWPMSGDEVIHHSTQIVVGHITSIGYNEENHDEIYALVSLSNEHQDGNIKNVLVRTGAGNFDAKIVS